MIAPAAAVVIVLVSGTGGLGRIGHGVGSAPEGSAMPLGTSPHALPSLGEPRPGSGSADLAHDLTIVPGRRVGAITADTSADELRRLYGKTEVIDRGIDTEPGLDPVPGSLVFPNDSARRLEVIWRDATRTRPSRVRIYEPKSLWRTSQGIGIGTTLLEVEKLNGKPFVLTGFESDFGGTVVDWNGGRLAPWQGNTFIRLDESREARDDPSRPFGDRDFNSDLAAMRKAKPTVCEIDVDFP
jgi:hypothetical protein